MARLRLSQLPGWQLANPKQDLRGLTVVNAHGDKIGTVLDLVVDTLTDLADAVVLDSGAAYRLSILEHKDSAVRVREPH